MIKFFSLDPLRFFKTERDDFSVYLVQCTQVNNMIVMLLNEGASVAQLSVGASVTQLSQIYIYSAFHLSP
jgi:hypothetical protein